MSEEIWKPVSISGSDTGWQVSNLGNFLNKKGNIAKQHLRSRGYKSVTIVGRTHDSHRIIASHFCEMKEGCNTVDHIDNDKLNNRADNLEWVTMSENIKRSFKFRKKRLYPVVSPQDVLKVVKLLDAGMSNNKIALAIGCDSKLISSIKHGKAYANISGIGKNIENTLENFIEK